MNDKDLWAQRSVGIKIWSFDKDPYEISKSLKALSNPTARGESHGSKSTFKENQIHILKLMEADSCWGESLKELVFDLGGIEEVLKLIKFVQPKNYFIVVNIPTSDAWCGNGNNISKEVVETLYRLNADVSFNYF